MDTLGSGVRSSYINGTQIPFPTEFASYLAEIALILGHDTFVRHDIINLPYELISTPFRRTQLPPLLTPLGTYLQPEIFEMIKPSLYRCSPSDTGCAMIYDFAMELPFAFVLLHENAHQRLHHRGKSVLRLKQELEADASALAALKIMRDELTNNASLSPNAKEELRWIFDVAPAMWLQVDVLRLGSNGAEAAARLRAVLGADVNVSREFTAYMVPEHRLNSLITLHIHVDHPVQRYVIDGLFVLPSSLPEDGTMVTDDLHTIVALCADGIAVSRTHGEPHFVFASYDAVPSDSLRRDVEEGKWTQVLAETSTIDLAARSETVLGFHTRALAYLGLGGLISSHDLTTLQGNDLQASITSDCQLWDLFPAAIKRFTPELSTTPPSAKRKLA